MDYVDQKVTLYCSVKVPLLQSQKKLTKALFVIHSSRNSQK